MKLLSLPCYCASLRQTAGRGREQLRKLRPRWEAAQQAFEKRVGRDAAAALKHAAYLAASKLVEN